VILNNIHFERDPLTMSPIEFLTCIVPGDAPSDTFILDFLRCLPSSSVTDEDGEDTDVRNSLCLFNSCLNSRSFQVSPLPPFPLIFFFLRRSVGYSSAVSICEELYPRIAIILMNIHKCSPINNNNSGSKSCYLFKGKAFSAPLC